MQEDEPGMAGQELAQEVNQLKRHLEMLDQRLDNIDSVTTALVERVMKQPVTLSLTCPHCGKNIEIAIIGGHKPTA